MKAIKVEDAYLKIFEDVATGAFDGLCCATPCGDSCCESSMITGKYEQTHTSDL